MKLSYINKRFFIVLLWTLLVGVLIVHNLYLFMGGHVRPDTDIMALLPAEKQDRVLQKAFQQMVNASEQRIIVLAGAKDWNDAVRTADSYESVIAQHPDLLKIAVPDEQEAQNEWLPFFSKYRNNLLTPEQRKQIETRLPEDWVDTVLAKLYSPFAGPKLIPWHEDPFDLFNGWIQNRMQETPVRPRDGKLFVADESRQYVVIPLVMQESAFSLNAQKAVIPVLKEALEKAKQTDTNASILTAGVILHAAAASEHANEEMSIIGTGSMIGIVLLIWITFRRIRPVFLILLSLGTGVLGALSVCHLLYGQIHILTLVFGASLIGIAQDYGIYYLCNRAHADNRTNSWRLAHILLPGMALTLATTVIGYMGLALTPFPGLRQMAVFAAAGLIFAWLTVLCWFPLFVSEKTFQHKLGWQSYQRSIHHWPTAGFNKRTLIVFLIFTGISLAGLYRLNINDDLRILQNPDRELVEQQQKIFSLLDMPAMTQFYLVRGDSPEEVLQKEEKLKERLDPMVENQTIKAYQSTSNWVPSIQTQQKNRDLIKNRLFNENGPYEAIKKKMDFDKNDINRTGENDGFMTVDQFRNTSARDMLSYLWLGKTDKVYASILTIRGVTKENMEKLRQIPDGLDGVQWVDKVGEISSVLGHYRYTMAWVVVAAYFIIYCLLFLRYHRDAWRVVIPPFLATTGTLAILGLFGKDLHLFNTLAFMLILGIGVDSGIFFQENVAKNRETLWLEIGLSASSTILSFGFLSLSSTPALHSFGLTMLTGITLVWIIVPCFGKKQDEMPVPAEDTHEKKK